MSRDINPFGVRMPDELRAKIEKAAANSGRSMNAEIIYRLEYSFTAAQSAELIVGLSMKLEEQFMDLKQSVQGLRSSTEVLEYLLNKVSAETSKPRKRKTG